MMRKKWIVFFMFFFVLLGIMRFKNIWITKNVEANVIRFHVKANSNEKMDQEHKLVVRDAVVAFLKTKMKRAQTKEEAMKELEENQDEIKKEAMKVLRTLGDDHTVSVVIRREKFPEKDYGSHVFPGGTYDALRVNIGEAKGKNFWCVMFPELCITKKGEVTTVEEARKELKQQVGMLTEWMIRKK